MPPLRPNRRDVRGPPRSKPAAQALHGLRFAAQSDALMEKCGVLASASAESWRRCAVLLLKKKEKGQHKIYLLAYGHRAVDGMR